MLEQFKISELANSVIKFESSDDKRELDLFLLQEDALIWDSHYYEDSANSVAANHNRRMQRADGIWRIRFNSRSKLRLAWRDPLVDLPGLSRERCQKKKKRRRAFSWQFNVFLLAWIQNFRFELRSSRFNCAPVVRRSLLEGCSKNFWKLGFINVIKIINW